MRLPLTATATVKNIQTVKHIMTLHAPPESVAIVTKRNTVWDPHNQLLVWANRLCSAPTQAMLGVLKRSIKRGDGAYIAEMTDVLQMTNLGAKY